MSKLLVSVRAVEEVESALCGGADIIDVKEPARGSLGRADSRIIAGVLKQVNGRVPVSAAMGEMPRQKRSLVLQGTRVWDPRISKGDVHESFLRLSYMKWGFCGWGKRSGWVEALNEAAETLRSCAPACRAVAVAYADWQRAQAPKPWDICRSACNSRIGAMLVDTWKKDGTALLDWLSFAEIARLVETCRSHHLFIALAGSLGPKDVERLVPLNPDWFAVRGAACREGMRAGPICELRVRALNRILERRELQTVNCGN
jgi:uncharacterized protein (UPF0264 family)